MCDKSLDFSKLLTFCAGDDKIHTRYLLITKMINGKYPFELKVKQNNNGTYCYFVDLIEDPEIKKFENYQIKSINCTEVDNLDHNQVMDLLNKTQEAFIYFFF